MVRQGKRPPITWPDLEAAYARATSHEECRGLIHAARFATVPPIPNDPKILTDVRRLQTGVAFLTRIGDEKGLGEQDSEIRALARKVLAECYLPNPGWHGNSSERREPLPRGVPEAIQVAIVRMTTQIVEFYKDSRHAPRRGEKPEQRAATELCSFLAAALRPESYARGDVYAAICATGLFQAIRADASGDFDAIPYLYEYICERRRQSFGYQLMTVLCEDQVRIEPLEHTYVCDEDTNRAALQSTKAREHWQRDCARVFTVVSTSWDDAEQKLLHLFVGFSANCTPRPMQPRKRRARRA